MSLNTLKKTPIVEDESATATVLSMKLKRLAPEIPAAKPANAPVQSTDDIDDIWDNMPV